MNNKQVLKFGLVFITIVALFLLLNKNPQNLIKDIQLDFLKDQKITICWIEDNNIVSLNNKILF